MFLYNWASCICMQKYVIGARLLELWAYKREDARRKDQALCFAHSLVLCTNESWSLPGSVSAHFLISVTK